jgi:carboxypeptidase C (cathepsin A)
MLKYSGDTDGAVPLTGTMGWIDSMNLPIINEWRPYFVNNATSNYLGGYIVDYNNMTLGTVHGAGHMAPQFRPEATYHLIFNWLYNKTI